MLVCDKVGVIAIIVVMALMLGTILLLRYRIRATKKTIEEFDQSERLSKALESNITKYEERLNTLRNALVILKEDTLAPGASARDVNVVGARHGSKDRTEGLVAKSTRKPSSLNTYERSLGSSWLNVKNNDMDNTPLVRKLLKELGLPESSNPDEEKAHYENYCILRKATRQCVVGRKDCVDHCNPPDSTAKIWG